MGGADEPAPPPLAGDVSGITALPNCALAQGGACLVPIARSKAEVCARWEADRPKQTDVFYVPATAACAPGETTAAGQADAVRRVNLARWLSGLEPVRVNSQWSTLASACAIIQAHLGDLDHYPEPTATCYTAAGGAASGESQLALNARTPADAIDNLIWDSGDNNRHILGHRHGLLLPGVREIGVGFARPNNGIDATCVRSFDGTPVSRPAGFAGMVAYPHFGWVPHEIVSRTSYVYRPGDRLEWSVSFASDVTTAGASVRLFRQAAAYERVTITFGPYADAIAPEGFWIEPDPDPMAAGTYVVLVDGTSLGPFGYRIRLESCGPKLPLTCDVLAQDCGVPGYGCYEPGHGLCGKSGGIAIGQPCPGLLPEECVPGATCEPLIANRALSICTPYCDPEDPTAPKACAKLCPGNEVVIYDSVAIAPIGAYCLPGTGGACNPLAPSCSPTQGCYGIDTTACELAGTTPARAECVGLFEETCVPGTTCAGIQGSAKQYCQPYCDPAPSATGPKACATLCPGAFWDFDSYGICIPPA